MRTGSAPTPNRSPKKDPIPPGLAGAGPALFSLVRFWSRRWVAAAVDGLGDDDARTLDVLVVDAVAAAERQGSTSIAAVARELGIDRSGASRMVSDAADRGHVRKGRSSEDARRTTVELTAAGRGLLAGAHTWQEQAFARLVDTWDPDDAARLATYLRRLDAETATSGRVDRDPGTDGPTTDGPTREDAT